VPHQRVFCLIEIDYARVRSYFVTDTRMSARCTPRTSRSKRDEGRLTVIVSPIVIPIRPDPSSLFVPLPADIVDIAKDLVPRDPTDDVFTRLGEWFGECRRWSRGKVVGLVGPLRRRVDDQELDRVRQHRQSWRASPAHIVYPAQIGPPQLGLDQLPHRLALQLHRRLVPLPSFYTLDDAIIPFFRCSSVLYQLTFRRTRARGGGRW
jgi:hypothetical protein